MDEFSGHSGSSESSEDIRSSSERPASGSSLGSGVSAGGIVAARGTAAGLSLRLDSRASQLDLERALREYVETRRGFLGGNNVSLEWIGGAPTKEVEEGVRALLKREFSVEVVHSGLFQRSEAPLSGSEREITHLTNVADDGDSIDDGGQEEVERFLGSGSRKKSLFDGIEVLNVLDDAPERVEPSSSAPAESGFQFWDDPEARMVYATLRSGQRIETEHSLIVFGDVNSGAELVAGGDIVVLGKLRGVAHAGAYEEGGGGRVILSLALQPTQLRIGEVISRGSEEKGAGVEIAHVQGEQIVVEPYNPKLVTKRR